MNDPIHELKVRAELLHHGVSALEASALERLRALPEHKKADADQLSEAAKAIRRKHCLAVVAREAGFQSWSHANDVVAGRNAEDFGTLLNPPGASAHWNIWSASYDEAREIRREHGGYLLAYKRHFFIVDRYYIETLGLDPEDEDWERIGRDWVRPLDLAARARLYAKLLLQAPRHV